MTKTPILSTLIFSLILMVLLTGCRGLFSTPIEKIIDNPREYDGKDVTISGSVTEVFSLVFIKYYMVKDSTGEIAVITQRPVPKRGTTIRVKGTVKEGFSLGDKHVLVIVEKEES